MTKDKINQLINKHHNDILSNEFLREIKQYYDLIPITYLCDMEIYYISDLDIEISVGQF